jgi:hypothetical protein
MKVLTPVKAIRAKCLVCAAGRKAVRECPRGPESLEPCALHPFRMGRNPAREGIGRAMSSEDARSTRKPTSQVVVSATPRERRRIRESALAILLGPGAREQHEMKALTPEARRSRRGIGEG